MVLISSFLSLPLWLRVIIILLIIVFFAGIRIVRPTQRGPSGPPDPTPNPAHDLIVDGFEELAARLGA